MSFWDDVALAVQSGDVSAADAKIGIGALGLMHEVLNPGQRAPAPVDKMVDDLLVAVLGAGATGGAEESAVVVAGFLKSVIATNPVLRRFGAALAKQWSEAEAKRSALLGNEASNRPVGAAKAPGALSPLAARISQLKK